LYVPLAQALASFGPKSCLLVNYSPNPSSVPYLKQLASRVAEISRGSQIFGYFPSPDPRQFWSSSGCFLVRSPNPSCVLNLELLASTVANIRRWSEVFLDAPLTQTPSNFGHKSCVDAFANTFIRILVTGNCRDLKYRCALNSGQGASNSGHWPEYRYPVARIMLQWPEFGSLALCM